MNDDLHACRCCGATTISEPGGYEICDVCGWEDDPVQNQDPNYAGGANDMSLRNARAHWEATHQRIPRNRSAA